LSYCSNCDRLLYDGPQRQRVDDLLCRECQKSPAVQLRVLLIHARDRGFAFDEAWEWAWARIRWPHDTTHRREWKAVLESADTHRVWGSAYRQQASSPREKVLVNLAGMELLAA
jgi:hypothetical protein